MAQLPTPDSRQSRDAQVASLKKAETQLRLMTKVFMDSADPIVIRDLEGRMIDVNHEVERVFGFSREELLGRETRQYLVPESAEGLDELFERRRRGETIRNLEVTVRAKSGRAVPVLATGFLLTDENDQPVGLADILKDITPMKQACERVKQRNRDLQQYARALSHDLANPLGAIRGFTEMLRDDHAQQLDKEGQEYTEMIVNSIDRMEQMIHDLLDLARIDGDSAQFTAVDMSQAFQDAVANLHAVIQESGARVTSDPLPTVQGNASLLSRLLQNLISNAVKFRREEPPQVHVSVREEAAAWRFSVQDNGIGVAPEDYDKVFVPLKRLHAESVYPGTGIGLAACRSIVERHGGTIWLESSEGQGSVFYFTIPYQPPQALSSGIASVASTT